MRGMAPPRVLVVDDEPMVREVLSRYLRRDGFEVATAADGEEALVRFGETEPDLVLLDLMLPRVDGYEVFRRLAGASSDPGDHAHRARRGDRQDRRARARSRRLHRQALLSERGRRPGPRRAPAHRAGRAGARGPRRSTGSRSRPSDAWCAVNGEPVSLTRKEFDLLHHFASSSRDHAHAIAAPRGGLGLRVGRRQLDGHGARAAAAREDRGRPLRARPSAHGVGRRLPVRAMSQLVRTGLVLAGIAAVSVLGGLVASAALGMSASETGSRRRPARPRRPRHRRSRPWLPPVRSPGASLQTRLVAVAIVAIVVALANLAVLAMDMVVSGDDAKLLAILLVYALVAGVAVAVALSRTIGPSFKRLDEHGGRARRGRSRRARRRSCERAGAGDARPNARRDGRAAPGSRGPSRRRSRRCAAT